MKIAEKELIDLIEKAVDGNLKHNAGWIQNTFNNDVEESDGNSAKLQVSMLVSCIRLSTELSVKSTLSVLEKLGLVDVDRQTEA